MKLSKEAVIKSISDRYEWFERMQKPLGHHSWWYTNRSSDDCIYVKLHAWIDMDEVTSKLSDQEKKIIETINLDIENYCNDLVWGDFGLVEQAREELEWELTKNYRVSKCEYGGKQGGWLCVVYEWENVYDDFDNGEYTYKELLNFKRIIDEAEEEVTNVTNLVEKRRKELCEAIENVDYYVDDLRNTLPEFLETKQEQAKAILSLT